MIHFLEIKRTSSPAAESTNDPAHWARLLISSTSLRVQTGKRVESVLTVRRNILLAKCMPLPRTVELDKTVDDDPRALYFRQATNGLYVRMALLTMLLDKD